MADGQKIPPTPSFDKLRTGFNKGAKKISRFIREILFLTLT
jgi:hypothetical protein